VETRSRRKLPKNVKLPPENERYMRCCADIASALIQDYEAQVGGSGPKKDLNLNALRGQMSKKHFLSTQPPLTAIIAAVPEHYKKYILPKLIAKPIRTFWKDQNMQMLIVYRNVIWHSCCRRNVQTPSLPAHILYGQYLRVLPWRPRFGFRILYSIVYWLRTDFNARHSGTV
jgi:hypothetical protein